MDCWRVFALFLIILVDAPWSSSAKQDQSATDHHKTKHHSQQSQSDEPARNDAGSNDDYCNHDEFEAKSSSDTLRLNFAGRFLADVSTYNNYAENFNINTFDPLKYPGWNPKGTGDFRLVDCAVTQACFGNGHCVDDHGTDGIVGQPIIGSDSTTTGKLVDLDPYNQEQSQIWGLVVGVDGFFKGDFAPRSFNHMHDACEGSECDIDTVSVMNKLSAVWFSTLQNVKWTNELLSKDSKFMQQVKSLRCMPGFQLYIKLNVYNMVVKAESPNFPYGRVVGTIYAKVSETPHPYGPYTRMLWGPPGPGGGHVPFYVDTNKKKVVLDLANIMKFDIEGNVVEPAPLYLKDKRESTNCEDMNNEENNLINNMTIDSDWFQKTAGIIEHPVEEEEIANNPLAIIQNETPRTTCKTVVEERRDGLFVQAIDNRVARKEPNSTWNMTFRAFQFGRSAKEVTIRPKQTSPENDSAIEIVSTEPSGDDGISSITFRSRDPGEPRREEQIDGQIYWYTVMARKGDHGTEFIVQDLIVSVHLYSEYTIPEEFEVTWYDHVYPILQQYANLYPVMKPIINLASYEDVVRKKKLLKHALELPEEDPNHMPVTRDLSPQKRKMILSWLDNEDPHTGRPELGRANHTLDELKKALQVALQLELSTIPPYLSALFSIKHGENEEVAALIRSVVVDEMKHMTLVANLLNAIGGAPKLNDKSIVPSYPAPLPGGANPGLVVKLARCSLNQIGTVFQGIERPNCQKGYSDAIEYLRNNKKRLINLKYSSYRKEKLPVDYSTMTEILHLCLKITTRPQTIGAIYIHQILCPMVILFIWKEDLFIGNSANSKQITENLWLGNDDSSPFAVNDMDSAVAAIVDIVTEGEGTDPCDPFDETGKLSHFFKFAEIVHGRRLKRLTETNPDEGGDKEEDKELAHFFDNFFECDEDMKCALKAFAFIGKLVPLYEDGVWPTISNPHNENYPEGSQARKYSDNFNMVYTGLLKCIHEAFNGAPDKIKTCMGMMSSLTAWGQKLVQTPIDPKGDPEIGPNAAPTFEFYDPNKTKDSKSK